MTDHTNTSIDFPDGTSQKIFSSKIYDYKTIISFINTVASDINNRYQEKKILLVDVLEGGRFFFDEIKKNLSFKPDLAELKIESYKGTSQTHDPNITLELTVINKEKIKNINLKKYDKIIIIDDILDTGKTMLHIITRYFDGFDIALYFLFEKDTPKRPKSIYDKLKKHINMKSLPVPDEFVLGSHLDLKLIHKNEKLHLFRNIKDLYAFNEKILPKLESFFKNHRKQLEEQLSTFITKK